MDLQSVTPVLGAEKKRTRRAESHAAARSDRQPRRRHGRRTAGPVPKRPRQPLVRERRRSQVASEPPAQERNDYSILGRCAARLIPQIVAKAGKRFNITHEDCQDIEQEAALEMWRHILVRGPRWARRKRRVKKFVKTAICDFMSARREFRHGPLYCRFSLDFRNFDADGRLNRLSESIDAEVLRTTWARSTAAQVRQLREEIDEVTQGLPEDLRRVAEALKAGNSPVVTAHDLRMRMSVFERRMAKLRAIFEAARCRGYFSAYFGGAMANAGDRTGEVHDALQRRG